MMPASQLLPNGSAYSSHAAYPAGATLLSAPAGTFMPGERRGGWTFRGNGGPAAVTLGNAANKPSGYAICKLSDGLKFAQGRIGGRVSTATFSKSQGSALDMESPAATTILRNVAGVAVSPTLKCGGIDNRWLMGIRGVRGRDIASMDLDCPTTKGPAAQILSPVARGGQREVVVIAYRLPKAGLADTHSHGGSFSRLRPWQVEDVRKGRQGVGNRFQEPGRFIRKGQGSDSRS